MKRSLTRYFLLAVIRATSLGAYVLFCARACLRNIGRKANQRLHPDNEEAPDRRDEQRPFDYINWLFSEPKR